MTRRLQKGKENDNVSTDTRLNTDFSPETNLCLLVTPMCVIFLTSIFDELVKNRKIALSVIPAKAGIQSIQALTKTLDSGFHRSDDILRVHQYYQGKITEASHFFKI